jgi:hypothetical protein
LPKFIGFRVTSGNGDAKSANRAAACDIVLRVADDDDSAIGPFAIAGEPICAPGNMIMGGSQGGGGDVVAVQMIVAIAAEEEPVPEVVVDQLSFCSFSDIAGKEAKRDIVAFGQSGYEAGRAWEHVSLVGVQCSFEATQISDTKSFPVFS